MEKKNPAETIFYPSEEIKLKMMHVKRDAEELIESTIADDKSFNESNHKNLEGKYILSTRELNQYIADDLQNGNGKGWADFTKDYSKLPIEQQVYYKPCVDTIGNYIRAEIGGYTIKDCAWGNFKPGISKAKLKKAHGHLEAVLAQTKATDDGMTLVGGLLSYADGVYSAAKGNLLGGAIKMQAGGMMVGHAVGQMVAQPTIDKNDKYMEEQRKIQEELRRKAQRNKRLNQMIKKNQSSWI